jgi:hypothetical protein
MKRICFIVLTVFSIFNSWSQKDVFLTLSPKVNGVDMQFSTNYVDLSGSVFNLDHFNYYLSKVQIVHDGNQITSIPDTVFLVKPDQFVLYLGNMNVTNIERINFGIGVPENINTESGSDAVDISAYPLGHPLSYQTPEMHWGWTSGYMHMIVGGNADANGDGTTETYFELHNVGDMNYKNVSIAVVPTISSTDQIDVYMNCNVDVWLKDLPLSIVGVLHGFSSYNADVMENVDTELIFTQSGTASVAENYSAVGDLYFANVDNGLSVSWRNVVGGNSFVLSDINGKVTKNGPVSEVNGVVVFEDLKNGVYSFCVMDENLNVLNTLKLVK